MRSPPETVLPFVLGKPVRPDTIFPRLFNGLRARGIEPRLHLPHNDQDAMPDWVRDAPLVVQRGLRPAALAALGCLEAHGTRCCNRVSATLLVEDRASLMERLRAAQLPVPRSERAGSWPEVLDRAAIGPMVVKRMDGRLGRGSGVAMAGPNGAPAEPPFPGPYLVQDRLATDGFDRKVYMAGPAARGLLKRWPRSPGVVSRPFSPEPDLAPLARVVGDLLEIDFYGVDFVMGHNGPVIVDVNAFPSFKEVPDAEMLIIDHLLVLRGKASSA